MIKADKAEKGKIDEEYFSMIKAKLDLLCN